MCDGREGEDDTDPVRNVVREEPEYIMRPQDARYGEYLTLPSLLTT